MVRTEEGGRKCQEGQRWRVGYGGDPSELDEPGQVTHQSLSFPICAGGFSIYFTLIKCMEACEGLIRALVHGTHSICHYLSPSHCHKGPRKALTPSGHPAHAA